MKTRTSWLVLLLLLTVRVGLAPSAAGEMPASPTRSAPEARPAILGLVAAADTEQPLAGARLEVFEQLDAAEARSRHAEGEPLGEPVATGTADKAGRFRIDVPAGKRLVVVASLPGRQRSSLEQTILLTSPGDRDLGRLNLPAGRRLSGKVLGADGRPVAGARVLALVTRSRARRGAGAGFGRRMVRDNSMPPFPVKAVSGADGSFVLDSLPERPLTVRAWSGGLAPALMENVRAGAGITLRLGTGYPLDGRVVAPDGKTPVAGAQVMAGEEGWDGVARTAADGSFHFDTLRKGQTSIVASISGSVTSGQTPAGGASTASGYFSASSPILVTLPAPQSASGSASPRLRLRPGAIVRARCLDSETRQPLAAAALTFSSPGEDEPRPAITGPLGEVLFTGVPPGNVRVRAEAEGYLEADLDNAPLTAGQARVWSAALRPASSIEGTVRDAVGRAVPAAHVSISGPPPFSLPVRAAIFFPIGVDPVVTDAQGRFRIEKLPSKVELEIGVEANGFSPWEMAGIKLRPGERRKDLEVLLDTGSIITGRLVDAEGQPVAGAGVAASRYHEGGPGGMVFRIDPGGGRPGGRGASGRGDEELPGVVSGPDGVFRVRGAREGIWSVTITARGHAPKTVAGLKLDDSAAALDAGDIVLEPGVSLRGRVVDATGAPIAYARGSLRREFELIGTFDTGADGAFLTEDLAPGDGMTLTVDADGYAAVEKRGLALPSEDLVLMLAAASRVSGQVLDRETRQPIPDFSIAMTRSRGGGGGGMMMNMAMAGPETPFHTEDGAFLVEDVDPGKVAIAARAPGYKESTKRDLEVPEGKDLDGLIFTLDRAASVSGTVLDDKGLPLPGVAVAKKETSSGGGMVIRAGGGNGGGATTDGDGAFLLTGIERGPLTLSFRHPEYEPADRDVDTTHDVEGLRVTLSRGATLSGVVLREEDGTPVSGASVSAVAAGSDRFGGGGSTTTGPDGAFALDAIPAGRYSLRAEASGLRTAVIDDVLVSPGAALPSYELRLGGGVTLSGTITGVRESELPQFTVRALSGSGGGPGGSGGFGTVAAVDDRGRFEIKGLASGTLTLIASSGPLGGKSATRTVQIPENTASFETTIDFPRGSKVAGDVTRGGRPIDGASVIFIQEATRARVTATTDASGHYVASDLDDGEYSVDVLLLSAGLSHSTTTSVKGDRTFDIVLPLARISGTVKGSATGQPLDGAIVSIKQEGAGSSSSGIGYVLQQGGRTDATGAYAIEGLEEGTYTLTARKDGYGYEPRSVTIAPTLDPGEVSFELTRVDAFTFRAIDAALGLPLSSLSALVLVGGGDPLAPTGLATTTVYRGRIAADGSGLFHLDTLQPGSYCIVLGGQGIATQTLYDVQVPPPATAPETIFTMVRGGSVEITAPSLKPAETARGVLLDAQGRAIHLDAFLPDPSFLLAPATPTALADVTPGTYRLRARMPGGGIAERPVQVVAGQLTKVSIP